MTITRAGRRWIVAIMVAGVIAIGGASASANDDVTPPTVQLTTPASGANYDQNAVIKASYSCSDASGIAACSGTTADGANIPTQTLGSHTFKVIGVDNAGNQTKVIHTYNVVDHTGPVVTISSPKDGATYAKNSSQVAAFSCYDTGVGMNSCVGTVSNGSNLPTGTTGYKSFTVTATDKANNTTTKVVHYQVV